MIEINISLSKKKLVPLLWYSVIFLTLASLAGQYSTYFLGDGHLHQLVPQFNLDREMNIPTWFASFLFLLAALLLWNIRIYEKKSNRRFSVYWLSLAIVFLILSIDEIAAIHETWVETFRRLFHARGVFYFSWVIPAIALVIIATVFYSKFTFLLPPKTRNRFLVSACVFLVGSLGIEMVSGLHVEHFGSQNFTYSLLANLEEFLEMAGLVLFISALLDFTDRKSLKKNRPVSVL